MLSLLRRLIQTESAWNPKVIAARVVIALLPPKAVRVIKREYYAQMFRRLPDDWHELDTRIVKKLVKPGDCVLDIGANLGRYSRMMSGLVGEQGIVHAFEPIPDTYDYLTSHLHR